VGLSISDRKYAIYFYGFNDEELSPFKNLFQYQFGDLKNGFKYLGCFMKPDNYRVEDWRWLVRKFEKRINHWCFRWLTLGGRFILIKSVLENLPVYLDVSFLNPNINFKFNQKEKKFFLMDKDQRKRWVFIFVTRKI
jgi:hypothetical protein